VPQQDVAAFKQQIASRRLEPIYLLVGEDLKLIDRMVDDVESTIDAGDRPFAVDRLYAGEPGGSPVEIVSSARTLPMLGDRRIVIVLRSERLFKPKRSAKATLLEDEPAETGSDEPVDAGPIEDYLEAPSSSTTVVFVAAEVDRTRRLTKRLVEKAVVVEFRGLGGARGEGRPTAGEWLQQELLRSGKKIDADAARLLASRAGNDISKLRGDLERLFLFTEGRPRIALDDVLEVVSEENAVDDEWAVVNAIANGDPARALLETGKRLDRGDSPHAFVGQLRWWVSARLAEGDPSRVKGALEALMRTDLALKSSGGDERILLERLVVELTGRSVTSRR